MTKLIPGLRRRSVFLSIGLVILALTVVLPLPIFAQGGVTLKVDAENLSTADPPGDNGTVGDELKVGVADLAGTSLASLTGSAEFKSAGVLPPKIYNIDTSTIGTGLPGAAVGCVRLEDTTQPGDHIDVCLLSPNIEVFITFAGSPTQTVRFFSGLDKLDLEVIAK